MRCAILGNSGSGKSTLARLLAADDGATLLDLDTVAREPGQIDGVDAGVARLRRDLDDGSWRARHGHLLDADAMDLGNRLVTATCR